MAVEGASNPLLTTLTIPVLFPNLLHSFFPLLPCGSPITVFPFKSFSSLFVPFLFSIDLERPITFQVYALHLFRYFPKWFNYELDLHLCSTVNFHFYFSVSISDSYDPIIIEEQRHYILFYHTYNITMKSYNIIAYRLLDFCCCLRS